MNWCGSATSVNSSPGEDRYTFQITEELREVLYLDAVELVAV